MSSAVQMEVRGFPRYTSMGPSIHIRRGMTDKQALSFVNDKIGDDSKDLLKHTFERQWFTSVVFFLGYQRLRTRGSLADLEQTPSGPNWHRYYIANRIGPLVMRQASKLAGEPIKWAVRPKSPDVGDLQAARIGEHFLHGVQEEIGIDDARWEVDLWRVLTGTGFYHVEWDPWANGSKRVYQDPVTGDEIPVENLPQEGRELLDKHGWFKDVPNGDIRVTARSPFDIIVPHMACGMHLDRKCPWMIIQEQIPVDALLERYPWRLVKGVEADRDLGVSNYFKRRMKTLVAQFGYFTAIEDREQEDMVTVRHVWIPPTAKMPKGRHIVATRNKILLNEDHPYRHTRIAFPVVKADYMPVPGRFWSRGMVEDLISPQSEYNRSRTTSHKIRDLMGSPKWGVEKGSGVTRVDSEAGQHLWFNRGSMPPQPIIPSVDHQMHELVTQHALDDMNVISIQQEPTQGGVPSGIRSGAALAQLTEQDDRAIAPAVRSGTRALSRVGRLVLRLAQVHISESRMLALRGREQAMDVTYFKGQDLRENDNVVIADGSLMPRSRAGEMQKTFDSVQLGVLNPANPMEKRVILRSINMGDTGGIFTTLEANERRAEIENDMYRSPRPNVPEVRVFDDHMVHIDIHNRFRLSDAFELMSPVMQDAFNQHCAVHEQALAQAQQMMMDQQAATQGTPGEKGQPSAPNQQRRTQGVPSAA